MPDLTRSEFVSLGAIAAVVLWMGVYPESFLAPVRRDVGWILARAERANPPGDAQRKGGPAPPKAPAPAPGPGPAPHEDPPGAAPHEHAPQPAPHEDPPGAEPHEHAPGEEH